MKTFKIDINSKLKDIEITVKNGARFTRCAIKGSFEVFEISVSKKDLDRIKKYAVKSGNDNNSNKGNWYAHCNGYSMDLLIDYKGWIAINTYFNFRGEKN